MKNKKILKEKGITLIALVITIIVLLILAGVSIAMLTGQNGILTQANNATIQQSHGAVKEGIALAYNEYQIEINIASNMKVASTKTVQIQGKEVKTLASYSSFLDFLESKGYIKEGTTDIINVEKLTGSKQALGNGTDTDVYKIEEENGKYIVNYYDDKGTPEEIWSIANNDNVEISITKTNLPNDENVVAVLLTVDKVIKNGSELSGTMQLTEDEYKKMLLQKLETMTDEEKGTMILGLFNILGAPFKDINEVIEYVYNQGVIGANTEDAFYEYVEANHDEFANEIYQFGYNLIGSYDKETGELQRYTVTNPEEEKLNTYVATKNGDYTFRVEIEGKEYSNTVQVDNINEGQEPGNYVVGNIATNVGGLKDVENDTFTTFSNAYVIFNNQIIDVTGAIETANDISALRIGEASEIVYQVTSEYLGTGMNDFLIVKDGNYYSGTITLTPM